MVMRFWAAVFVGLMKEEFEDKLDSTINNFILENKDRIIKEASIEDDGVFFHTDTVCEEYLELNSYESVLEEIGESLGIDGLTSFEGAYARRSQDMYIGFIICEEEDITDKFIDTLPEKIKKAKEKFKKAFDTEAKILLLSDDMFYI